MLKSLCPFYLSVFLFFQRLEYNTYTFVSTLRSTGGGSCLHTSGLEDGSCRGDQMAGISANILVLRLSVTEPEEQLRTAEAGGSWPT